MIDLLRRLVEAKEIIPSVQALQPEILGAHYNQNKEVTKGILRLLTMGGLSQEDAAEVVRRSEEPKMRGKLLTALRQVLTTVYGLSLEAASEFIEEYGDDKHSAEEMAAAIQRLPRGNRLGRATAGTLPGPQIRMLR